MILDKTPLKGVKMVNGNPASLGTVTGTVRVIRGEQDLEEVKPGDIIIATMTDPNFVPYMKKAVGIITELGGRTCHAAIVSRELRIPCMVAATGAMGIFKNGDRVQLEVTTTGAKAFQAVTV